MSSKKRKVFDPAEGDDDDRKPPAKVPARGDSRAVAKVRIHEEEENNGGGIDVFSIDLVSTNIFSYLDIFNNEIIKTFYWDYSLTFWIFPSLMFLDFRFYWFLC